MESDFEKKLHQVKPRGITEDEKAMLWSNIENSVQAEDLMKAHKKVTFGPFNLFLNIKKARYAIAAILTGTLLAGSFATVALADSSRPGDFLFPVELASETLHLRLTSPDNRDELRVQFASERLEEVKELLALANINFEELTYTTSADASTSTDDTATSTDDTATSTDDTTDDQDTSTTTDNTDDDQDNTNNTTTSGSDEGTSVDVEALAQASNAFLVALEYLENTKAMLIANGNDLAALAIDAFISELTVLANNHVGDIERARFVVENDPFGDSQQVSIAIRASIDNVKTEFKFDEVINEDGKSRQKITFKDGDGTVKLNISDYKTVYEIENTDDDNDDQSITVCYKSNTKKVKTKNIITYLKKGATFGECDNDDDGDDDSDNGKKLYICHQDKKTINVSIYARWAHVRHGDKVGKCDSDGKDDDNDVVVNAPNCSLSTADNRTIANFGGESIRSDSSEDAAQTSPEDVNLDSGTYRVTLMSWDGSVGRENKTQPNEQWFIKFLNNDTLVEESASVGDIADYVTEDTVIEVVNSSLVIDEDVDEVVAFHDVYPDTSSANSVHVICAAFDKISDDDGRDHDAPIISDIAASVSQTSTNISWKTDEGATSKVWYSETSGFDASGGTDFVSSGTLKENHLLTINGLTEATTYYYRVESEDSSNNQALSSEQSFTTFEGGDVTAPIITGIAINPTTTEATVAWITNEPTTGIVWYSENTPVDITGVSDGKLSNTLKTAHSVDILDLTSSTTYYYIVVATDESGNTSTSTEDSFDTTSPPEEPIDDTAPVISNIVASPTTTEATIGFTTDEDVTTVLWYGLTSGSLDLSETNGTLKALHEYTLLGLTPETTYYFEVVATDESGNSATSTEDSFTTTAVPADETAPVIESLSVEVASTTADVSFTTNEDATSKIYYSLTPSVDLNLADSIENNSFSTTHDFGLTGLTASTTYYYIVTATDESLNERVESESSFETL